jgi:hypothetical protein
VREDDTLLNTLSDSEDFGDGGNGGDALAKAPAIGQNAAPAFDDSAVRHAETVTTNQHVLKQVNQLSRKESSVLDEINERVKEKRFQENLYSNLLATRNSDPNVAVRAKALEDYLGLDAGILERNPQDAERMRLEKSLLEAAKASPAMREFWKNPYNLKISKDDTDALGKLELAGKSFFGSMIAGNWAAFAGLNESLNRVLYAADKKMASAFSWLDKDTFAYRILADVPPENEHWLRQNQQYWYGQRTKAENALADEVGDLSGLSYADQTISSVASGLGGMFLPLKYATPISNVLNVQKSIAAVSAFAALDVGHTGGRAMDAGVDVKTQLAWQAYNGISMALWQAPWGKLFKGLESGTPFYKIIPNQIAHGVQAGVGVEALHIASDKIYDPNAPAAAEAIAQAPERLTRTAVDMTVISALTGGFGALGYRLANGPVRRDVFRANQAEQDFSVGRALVDALRESKTNERDQKAAEEFIDRVTEGRDYYIDGEALKQSGLAEMLVEAIPEAREKIITALEVGGDAQIRLAAVARAVAKDARLEPILEHSRTNVDGMSPAEAREFGKTNLDEVVAIEAEKALAEVERQAAADVSMNAVKADMLAQLNAAGRDTKPQRVFQAALWGRRYQSLADRMNEGMPPEQHVTAEQLYRQERPNIVAEGLAGYERLGQRSRATLEEATQNWQKALNAFSSSKPEYIPKIITPSALKAMGLSNEYLGLSTETIRKIAQKHSDVPFEIIKNLPNYLRDPLLIYPYRSGGVRVIIDAVTEKGDPIAVGVEDGRIRTITSLENSGEFSGWDRINGAFYKASEDAKATVYARDAKTLTEARVSAALRQAGPNSPVTDTRARSTVKLGAHLVKKYGEGFYQGGAEQQQPKSLADKVKRLFKGKEADDFGAFYPNINTIALFKNANLSTFLHETGHFFLKSQLDLAGRLSAEAKGKPLAAGRQRIVDDSKVLLDWFGVKDLETWNGMTLDQQRPYHERFARAFEKYLYDGQAPSVGMQGMFRRFREWLVNVYRDGSLGGIAFSPEVREVFDRMLATDAQIAEMREIQGMESRFRTAEKAGMSPEQFQAYQAMIRDANEEAIESHGARLLRDTEYMHNARNREARRLQRVSAALRREARMEATTEIMSEPVYQAWDFLTRKLAPEDRLQKQKVSSEMLDPANDSLLTAIAKLGGLNRDQVRSEWGVTDAVESTVFGKPVLRANGGRTLDGMAEALAERGYLPKDENGKADIRALEEAFSDELVGSQRFSLEREHKVEGDQIVNPSALGAGRLDAPTLRVMGFSEAEIALLRDRGMTANEGLHPDTVAYAKGFRSGEELVNALLKAESPKAAIEGLTDALMLERHSDLATPQAVALSADRAIHNRVHARALETELAAADTALGRKDLNKAAARIYAAKVVGRTAVADLNPALFSVNARKAGAAAEKARVKGDFQGYADFKRQQLFNTYAVVAAYRAKEDIGKALRYFRTLNKVDGPRKNIDVDYRDQIDALLEQHGLRKQAQNRAAQREPLSSFVEYVAEQGYDPNIHESLLSGGGKDYGLLSVEAFCGLTEAVKSLQHIGRQTTIVRDGERRRDIMSLADEAWKAGEKMPDRAPETNRGLSRIKEAWMSVKAIGRSGEAALLKIEQMCDWLDASADGTNPNGVFNRVMFRRVATAATKENDMLVKVGKNFDALAESTLQDTPRGKGLFTAEKLIDSVTGEPMRLTQKQKLAFAGNMGNRSNIEKMLKAEGWKEADVWDFLDKNMTKGEWDFVAGFARAFEQVGHEKLPMLRRMGNSAPEMVEPAPFETRHGKYDGWYWPMIYDPARAFDVAERGDIRSEALFENRYKRINTDTGRMNTRVETYARPILMDLDAVVRVLKSEIHDVAFREAVVDVNKFIRNPRIREYVETKLSPQHYAQLEPWLRTIANEGKIDESGMRALKFFNGFFRWARLNVQIVGLGYRFTTAIVHGTTAGGESVAELGPKWTAIGIKEFSNPAQWAANKDFIFERSGEMRHRMHEVDRDVRDALREIDRKLMNPAISKAERATLAFRRYAYHLIAMSDMASALPTWMGAYLKAMTPKERGGLGYGEADAVYFADKTVRNAHGGAGVKDLAAVQRGPEAFKLFTMFYNFWNHNANRLMNTGRMAKDLPREFREATMTGEWSKFGGDLTTVLLRSLVYTLYAQAVHGMFSDHGGDEDEPWLKWAAREIGAATLAGVPLGREIGALTFHGKRYEMSPVSSMVHAFGRTSKDFQDAMAGDTVSDKWLKHTFTTTGYLFGLPVGQVANTGQFLWDIFDGNQDPDTIAEWFDGILHGDMNRNKR